MRLLYSLETIRKCNGYCASTRTADKLCYTLGNVYSVGLEEGESLGTGLRSCLVVLFLPMNKIDRDYKSAHTCIT